MATDRWGPLREANFRRLWIGQSTSAVGDGVTGVALTFAVLGVTGSATDLGLVLAAFMLPRVVFLLVGGVWADRVPRHLIMLGADLVRAAAQAALAGAFLTGTASLPSSLAVAAASGAASAFFVPASIGLVPQAVSPAVSSRAMRSSTCRSRARPSWVPVLSGLLVVSIGPAWIFAFDAVTFVVSAVALAMLRLDPLPPLEARPFLADLAAGWREVASPAAGSLPRWRASRSSISPSPASWCIAPLVVERGYGGAPDWGLLMAAFGLGGLLGGAAALRWSPARPLVAVFAVLLAAPLCLVLLAAMPPLALLLVGVVAFASATAFANTIWHTTLQRQVPPASISRVSSYDWMASLVFFPAGAALAGPIAEATSPTLALAGFAAASGLALVATLAVPSVRRLAVATATPVEEPAPEVARRAA